MSQGQLFYGENIPDPTYVKTEGDVLVVPPIPGRHKWGHIEVSYDGGWVSDYPQHFASPYYKDKQSVFYQIYRLPNVKP